MVGVGLVAVVAVVAAAVAGGRAARRANRGQPAEPGILGQQERDRLAALRRADAAAVTVWADTEEEQPVVRYVNGSLTPVYGLTVWIATPDHSFCIERSVSTPCPDGRIMRTMSTRLRELARTLDYSPDWPALLSAQRLLCASTFRDPAGQWWSRTFAGELHEADSAELARDRVLADRRDRFPSAVDAPAHQR